MSCPVLVRRAFGYVLLAFALSACPSPDEAPRSEVPAPPAPPAAQPADVAGTRRPAVRPGALPDFTDLVETQGPAVVNVVTSRPHPSVPGGLGARPDDPLLDFFRRFIPDLPSRGGPAPLLQGQGSGFIISQDGRVLTNAHVVADAVAVTVRLADGKHEYAAQVLGADSRSDIALLKIDASDLPVATLGNSASVRPGEWVTAIGSPFGFRNTITAGIVSATNRELPDEALVPFIQTDVAVNPGNSGGPLLNLAGQVIGINSMIYSGTGGYMGVSFAIPIEVALDVARQLQTQGKVTRGRLGVGIQPMTAELARAFGLPAPNGVVVTAVEPAGPAARAGLRSGDVILEFNGEAIENASQLPRLVAASPPGSAAALVIWRNGARREVKATVGEVPGERAPRAQRPARTRPANRLGLVLSEAPPALRRQLGIGFGLVVETVSGAAADKPIRPGDVIVSINQRSFASLAEFNRLLGERAPGDTVAFLVRRGDQATYVTVTLR